MPGRRSRRGGRPGRHHGRAGSRLLDGLGGRLRVRHEEPVVLVRTDFRALGGNAGNYNPMLTQAATARIDLPAGPTTEVIAAMLDALARIEADRP